MPALTRRGLIDNARGYMIYGDYSREGPQAEIVEAIARGEIDVAFVWGPVAGHFAPQRENDLELAPMAAAEPRMSFGISMGVSTKNEELAEEVQTALARRSIADFRAFIMLGCLAPRAAHAVSTARFVRLPAAPAEHNALARLLSIR